MRFQITASIPGTYLRTGELHTAHGVVPTPTYMPVGTFGPVKLLDVEELRAMRAPIVLGNSLHLDMTATAALIQDMGGLAAFTGWRGPTLTDSGGYQVSYLWRSGTHSLERGERRHKPESPIEKITDEGIRMRSILTNERYWLTPERAMENQARIGADIVMAFDQPTFDTDTIESARATLQRSHEWILRSKRCWEDLKEKGVAPAGQAMFPIIQGGRHRELRRASTEHALTIDAPGIAIAGESIGMDPRVTAETLDMVGDLLPRDRPLYAMGLGGGPEGFFEAALRGVDLFDNTSPTRLGRCGLALVLPESGGTPENHFRLDVRKGRYRIDASPVDSNCRCKTCTNYSRAFIRHLFTIKDPVGMRLLSYHNLWYMLRLSETIRESIVAGDFKEVYRRWLGRDK